MASSDSEDKHNFEVGKKQPQFLKETPESLPSDSCPSQGFIYAYLPQSSPLFFIPITQGKKKSSSVFPLPTVKAEFGVQVNHKPSLLK